MKNLLSVLISAYFALGLLVAPAVAQSVGKATLSFNPASGQVYLNQNFNVDVMVNTGGDESAGADVYVKFNTSALEFISGTYDTTFYKGSGSVGITSPTTANSTGTVYMAGLVPAPPEGESPVYVKGSGKIATLTFRPKTLGQTTLSFRFDGLGETVDSNVTPRADSGIADLLYSVGTAAYTVIQGTEPPPTLGPVITLVTPDRGRADQNITVEIFGQRFGTATGSVYFGTRGAQVLSWGDGKAVVIAPQVPNLTKDSSYQVKLRRADGQEATASYLYLALPGSGPEILWLLFLAPFNGLFAWATRRLYLK